MVSSQGNLEGAVYLSASSVQPGWRRPNARADPDPMGSGESAL